jgi:hypothetical protein
MKNGPVGAGVAVTLARAAALCAAPRPRYGPDPLGDAFEAVMDAAPPGDDRRALLAGLAERRPDLVLRRAGDWLTDDDADVLVRLPEHHLRVAVAGARRPWSQRAIDAVVDALHDETGRAHRRSGADELQATAATDQVRVIDPADVLARVMADDYPELTRPHGVPTDPPCRWHIIGCEVWEWSLWRSDDGRHALEVVVSSGHADFEVAEMVDAALVAAWLGNGPATMDGAVERIRTRHRTAR